MISKESFLAFEDLDKEKGISQQQFVDMLQSALSAGYKKQFGEARGVKIVLSDEKKSIRFYATQEVVEEVEEPGKQISLADAQSIKKSYKVGDVITSEFSPAKDFGRIAVQTAKQVITQRMKEIEKAALQSEYEDKEGELLTCIVRRIDDENVYVEIGTNQMEGVMLPKDQVPGEKYELGQKLKVFVKKVKNTGKSTQVLVSRTSIGLVKKLFENEVPEIRQGLVQIKSVAREAGMRTKIAIYSEDPQIDPIGTCVGPKGVRVNSIVQELGGEKIDIIPWSENPLEFIAKALSPAKVTKVYELDGENSARAIVPDDKLSLAIGRDGQNARLAVKLTGWKIDVKAESVSEEL
ncbi:MAG: transcription termination factor NusA [Clostridia bacterium]|nr:transcription termination factor NusA [Clostridia bacterium]